MIVRWAKSLLDKVAESPSLVELDDYLRFYFIYYILAPPPLDRWTGEGESTGFWEPSANDWPLSP